MVNWGEVWWAESPNENRRPYLIVTREAAIPVLHSVLSVPATRTVREIPTEVALDRTDGMPQTCALMLDGMVLMPKAFLIERICRLGPERMAQVCRALRVAVGC